MNEEKHQFGPLPGRARQVRQTWFWTHLSFGLVFIVTAAIVYYQTGRTVLALIFGAAGLVELVNVFLNPVKRG